MARSPSRVDPAQCRALFVAGLRRDFRRGPVALGLGAHGGSGARAVLSFGALNLMLGGAMALLVWQLDDLRLATLVHLSFVAFNVGSVVVLDFHRLVLAPEDYDVLGYQPVGPQTFAAARLASLLLYTSAIGAALAALPAAAYAARVPAPAWGGLAVVAASLGLAASVGLAAAIAYAVALRLTPPLRLRSALTALQLAVSFVVYGSAVLVPSLLGRDVMRWPPVEPTFAWLWFPPFWWACWIDVARGSPAALAWTGAAAAGLSVAALLILAARTLSLDEADRLARSVSATAGPSATPRPRARWLAREALAVDVLARAQFRHDLRFRLSVLAIVPLTLVYLIAGVLGESTGEANPAPLVTVAALLFPSILLRAFVFSGDFRAAWVFYATPASGSALVLALRGLIVRRFLAPYLAFVGVLLVFVVTDLARLGVMLALLALGSHAILLVVMIAAPGLPFSQPPDRVSQSRRTVGLFILMGIAVGVAQGGLTLALWNPLTMAAALALAIGVNVVFEQVLRRRIDRLMAGVEFAG